MDTVENWKLKIKNWKHCSKIIFKCVNSTVRPIFNEKVVEKWCLWVSWIVEGCTVHAKSQHSRLKRKKKNWKRKHETQIIRIQMPYVHAEYALKKCEKTTKNFTSKAPIDKFYSTKSSSIILMWNLPFYIFLYLSIINKTILYVH